MTKQFYDGFSKLPIAKMAQPIAVMTYLFNEMKVPTTHFKAQLSKCFEEMVEANVSVSLVNTIFNTLHALQKESPKLFYQAVLCLDTKVKPNSIPPSQYQAMEFAWSQFENNTSKNMLAKEYIQIFYQVKEKGLNYYTNNQRPSAEE